MATTGVFDQGAPQFGLNDAVIAPWPGYTPITDIMSVQLGTVAMEVVSAILTGDDRQTAVSSNAIGGTVQVRMGGLNPSILAVLLGKAVTSSASVRQLMITGGLKMPYVGICLKALSAETGDTWILDTKSQDYQSPLPSPRWSTAPLRFPKSRSRSWMIPFGALSTSSPIRPMCDITVLPPANITQLA